MTERTIKPNNMGERPHFFDDPAVDQLLAMMLALMGELSVVTDRLDSVERLLDAGGTVTRADVEAYRPDEAVAKERSDRRRAYVDRVFRVLREERAHLVSHGKMAAYRDLMNDLANKDS